MTATLVFKIIGDAKQATSEIDKFTGGLDAMTGPALAAGGAVAAGLGYAIKAASDAEQAVGAMNAVFGEQSAAMAKAAESANALGMSTADYNQAAAITGALLKNTGTEADALAGTTSDLIDLSADMAAQFGGSTTDALGAVQSMLKGSYEVMDNYGVKLTAASVAAYAAEHGLTSAEAAMALMNEQLSDTGTIGAAAREMDTLASQSASAQAAIDDAAASIGDDLLPLLADLAGELKEGAGWMADHEDAVRAAAIAVGVLAAAVLGINAVIRISTAVMGVYNGVLGAYQAVQLVAATAGYILAGAEMAALWPIALIVAGIVALIAVVVLLVKNWDTVSKVMKGLWNWIKGTFMGVWDALSGAISKVVDKIKAVWEWIKKILDSGVGKIAGLFGKSGPAGMTIAATSIMPTTATGRATTSAGGTTIVFNGLVTDPEGTARTIRRLLEGSDRRNGWAGP